jgi:Holliday junction resolvase
MREKTYENKIKDHLKEAGAYFVKYFGCAFTQAGVPDILAGVNGYFLAIEVKNETGKPSELQKINIHQINKAGAYAVIARPADFEELKRVIFYLVIGDTHNARSTIAEINLQYM